MLEDPIFVYAFMQTFVDTLEDYFDPVSVYTLKEHFDVIYEVCFLVFRFGDLVTFPDLVYFQSCSKRCWTMDTR